MTCHIRPFMRNWKFIHKYTTESPFLTTKMIMSCISFSSLFISSYPLPQEWGNFWNPQGRRGASSVIIACWCGHTLPGLCPTVSSQWGPGHDRAPARAGPHSNVPSPSGCWWREGWLESACLVICFPSLGLSYTPLVGKGKAVFPSSCLTWVRSKSRVISHVHSTLWRKPGDLNWLLIKEQFQLVAITG